MADTTAAGHGDGESGESRRDFLTLAAYTMSAWGAVAAGVALVDSMNPAADTLALASTEVDLSPIEEGQAITVIWRGKPVFIRNRTPAEIETAQSVPLNALPDPQSDEDRVTEGKENWLILVGVCTHLGCVPLGQKAGDNKGEYDGWFCPCHGSHYDTSGRIRKGPAPANLPVPPVEFQTDTYIKIG